MSKFLKYIITILLMAVCIFELFVFGILHQKKNVFDSAFNSVIVDKYNILKNTNEKKIIIVAGSSAAFGIDQRMLEKETGYKVANLGVQAGFGHLFYSELAKENINEGDIVLLGYEYSWYKDIDKLSPYFIMTGIDDNIELYKHIPIGHWGEFVGFLLDYAQIKNTFKGESGVYSRESFSKEDYQLILNRDSTLSDYYERQDDYGVLTIDKKDGKEFISDASISYLTKFKKFVESKGASIYFVAPPILKDSIVCDTDSYLRLAKLEEEKIGIDYISDPREYMFSSDLMYNSVYHCNNEGEKVRTRLLINDLKRCGAIEGEIND